MCCWGPSAHTSWTDYFSPVILTNASSNLSMFYPKRFGPVAAVKTLDAEEEAITLASNT
jgi:acyl-CoA reductase-like NAD-dependent aldehyde dehydrogenase